MALTYGAGVNDVTNYTNNSALANMTAVTYALWIYPTTLTNARSIFGKLRRNLALNGTIGNVSFTVARTTQTQFITNDFPLVNVNTWYFIAVTYNSAVSPTVHIYSGKLDTTLVERTYGTATDGSGTATDDSTSALGVGNNQGSSPSGVAFQGRVAWFGVWNRALSIGELKDQQYNPHVTSGSLIFAHQYSALVIPNWCSGGSALGGANSGATLSAHVPLRPYNQYTDWQLYTVPVTATPQTVTPTAISGGSTLGGQTLKGLFTLITSGIASGNTEGQPTLKPTNTLVPSARASSLVLGNPALLPLYTLLPTSRPSSLGVGNPALASLYTLQPTAIGPASVVPNPTLLTFNTLSPTSRGSTLALGNHTLLGLYNLLVNSRPSTASEGNPTISSVSLLNPGSRGSTLVVNNPTLISFNSLHPTARASTFNAGLPRLVGQYLLQPTSRISTIITGNPSLVQHVNIQPGSVPSTPAVGSPSLSSIYAIKPSSRLSSLVLGSHRLASLAAITPTSRLSTLNFGLPRIFQIVFPSVCEPLTLVIERTTPTGLLIASSGLTELQVVHEANTVLEVIQNETILGIDGPIITLLEVVCDAG